MSERIHDDEPDTSEPVLRSLLEIECPQWAETSAEYLKTSGTDNAMWRLRTNEGADVVVRLPRRPDAAENLLYETAVLKRLEEKPIGSGVTTPMVRHVGQPQAAFPHNWSVLQWIEGEDAWSVRDQLSGRSLDVLAADLAESVDAIGSVTDHDAPQRAPGSRGGPLRPLLDRVNGWLDSPDWNAASLVDVCAIRRLTAQALEVADEPVTHGFVHGDLIPGNLLVRAQRLTAIIDWGGAGFGDRAQDFAPAWAVLTESQRPAFKEAVGADDAEWIRGWAFELEHAVGGVLYYRPKKHPLGDVMERTLNRILTSRSL